MAWYKRSAGVHPLGQLAQCAWLQFLCMRSLLCRHILSQVLDEPLYAHFLRLTGAERPYTDLVGGCWGLFGCRYCVGAGHSFPLGKCTGALWNVAQW